MESRQENQNQKDEKETLRKEIHIPPELAPSAELIEKSKNRRVKDYVYDKEGDVYFLTVFNGREDPNGVHLHQLLALPSYLTENDNQYTFEDKKRYENSFIFIKDAKTLFHIKNAKAEKVDILKEENFLKCFSEIMDNEDYEYNTKWLAQEEFNQLILSNCRLADNEASNTSQSPLPRKLMKDLFPDKKEEIPLTTQIKSKSFGYCS